MKSFTDSILAQWKNWGGDAPKAFGIGAQPANNKAASNQGKETTGWHWEHAYRIDIRTNFNEDWFKKKFKSGLLNAAIRAIKTSALNNVSPDVKAKGEQYSNAGHKFTYDQMEPSEKKKLDSLQWSMTNKVAKMFIQTLLGWSRKKQKYIDEKTDQPMPKESLTVD